MKKPLLCFLFIAFSAILFSQKDAVGIINNENALNTNKEIQNINVSIYPVPVRNNSFTIKSDTGINSIRVTNVIGQDIYRINFITPQTISKVDLVHPQSGMYIVTIGFADNSRIVRKILIEGYN